MKKVSRTAVPLLRTTTQISSSLSPKRDCGSAGVKMGPTVSKTVTMPDFGHEGASSILAGVISIFFHFFFIFFVYV